MPDLALILAKNFKDIRQRIGTQERMADLMGTSQAQISRLESGENFSRMSKLGAQIAQAGGDPSDLLKRPDEPAASPLIAEIRALLNVVDEGTLRAILSLLRRLKPADKRIVGAE